MKLFGRKNRKRYWEKKKAHFGYCFVPRFLAHYIDNDNVSCNS